MVSVAAALFSHDSALLASGDTPGLSMGPFWTNPNILNTIIVYFFRDGNLIHVDPMTTSQGFLDLKPKTSVNLLQAMKEISFKTLSHPSVGGWMNYSCRASTQWNYHTAEKGRHY